MLTKTDNPVELEREPLDTRVEPHVRIINGSLDEDPSSPGSIVLQGRIDPNTLRFLKVDFDYQRPLGDRKDIYEALKAGVVVPNIEIGVRGAEVESDGHDYIIRAPAYIIDGWQRVGTAQQVLEQNPHHPIRIFGSVHFNTDAIWERHRFTELNKNVKKVSPNLHLRNMRDSNNAVLTLFGLCHNTKDFPLYKKVSWAQNMARGDLLSARVLAVTARLLHSHVAGSRGMRMEWITASLAVAATKVSLQTFRQNVMTFFSVVNECWGLRQIEYARSAPQLKQPFLAALARVFSQHADFWSDDGRSFVVDADYRRKLARFPINDPHVRNLAGSAGAAVFILQDMLVQHMNSGKRRENYLRSRYSRAG